MTRSNSYRLSKSDENDVRWGLAQDMKGDVGMRSGFDAFLNEMNLRSKLAPFVEKTPPRKRDWFHVDLSNHVFASEVMDVHATDHRTLLTYEMSTETTAAAERARHVHGAFALCGTFNLRTLSRCYFEECPGGLEAWDDLAALVIDTRAARYVDGGGFVSLMALSQRIRAATEEPETEIGKRALELDREHWGAIYAEADERLSEACRAYTKAVGEMRQARRIEQVQQITRRKRAN